MPHPYSVTGASGQRQDTTDLSPVHFARAVDDGLQSMNVLLKHQLALDRMLSPEEWRSIIDARRVLTHIQRRWCK